AGGIGAGRGGAKSGPAGAGHARPPLLRRPGAGADGGPGVAPPDHTDPGSPQPDCGRDYAGRANSVIKESPILNRVLGRGWHAFAALFFSANTLPPKAAKARHPEVDDRQMKLKCHQIAWIGGVGRKRGNVRVVTAGLCREPASGARKPVVPG